MIDALLSEDELMKKFNCKRSGDLRRILRNANVPIISGAYGKITTTLAAINQSMGVLPAVNTIQPEDDIEIL